MAGREELLRNLRRADQRRQRKPVVSPLSRPAPISPETAQIAELLVTLFGQTPSLTDRKVVAAIDSLVHERTTTDKETLMVKDALTKLIEREGANRQSLFKSLKQVATVIRTEYFPSTPQAYLQYLQILAG
jgi:hypothetical protein